MKINKPKLYMILLSCTLTFVSLGCDKNTITNENKSTIAVEDTNLKEETVVKKEAKETKKEAKETKKEQYNEEDVIAYFEDLEKDIYENLTKEDGTFDKIKGKCAYFVLFMSNEKEIKGYTWSELTDKTKEKIVEIFLRVDEKVENKYPDYMQKIKEYSKKASVFVTDTYQDLKAKANQVIDSKIDQTTQDEVKESFKDGYEDLKNSVQKGIEKVKKWARENS